MKRKIKNLYFLLKTSKDQLFSKKYYLGNSYLNNPFHISAKEKTQAEINKTIKRYDVINFVIGNLNRDVTYLEIGVRIPEENFDKINAATKFSVDPGVENIENPVDFKVTSDDFFNGLKKGKFLDKNILFDVIFIDGLHLAEQVERDIENALQYIKEDGYIILHDCNPPTQFHAGEDYNYRLSPSGGYWNGTTWKAFFKARKNKDLFTCCIDTDWGIGVINKTVNIGEWSTVSNPYFEYKTFEENREASLGLISFEAFKKKLD
ncbi:class I SAM-dependent methyltransferase [Patiriisocius marinus]|uniref:class I SAM-dependent methyltransferase n=1 Tax=Patiriisocius marinus TaxID=1397112 RepID=UPI00232AB9AA|nr:class I SAM-dependent methyltransferase [Patiriisocius marinus]